MLDGVEGLALLRALRVELQGVIETLICCLDAWDAGDAEPDDDSEPDDDAEPDEGAEPEDC